MVVTMAGEEVVVSYGPEPSVEDCAVSLLLRYVPKTLKELRPLFREHFPGVTFRQSSLMVGLEIDPRVVRLPGDRYGLRDEEDESDEAEAAPKQVEEVKAERRGTNIAAELGVGSLNLSDIALVALAFNSRTLRALTRQRLFSVAELLEHLESQSHCEDFQPQHWRDLFFTLKALVPAGHSARERISQLERLQFRRTPSVSLRSSPVSAEISDSEFRQMLEDTPEGGLLQLGGGTVRIEQPIMLSRSIRICGEGPETTRILYRGLPPNKSGILELSGQGPWQLKGLFIGFDSDQQSEPEDYGCFAVVVDEGEIECLDCRFSGARNVGLEINGDTIGYVSSCEFDNNMYGIWADDYCQVSFVNNRLHHNRDDGIVLAGETRSRVARNQSFDNEGCGIFVFRDAQPILERNILSGNVCGIYYGDDAGGTATENECRANKADGIRVLNEARPSLLGNVCQGNGGAGLSFGGASEGTAESNICADNQDGLRVTEDATPTLRDNTFTNNERHAAFFEKPDYARRVTAL
ncbi:MAG: right-handed parallel beta-helix repeat-containing protein [Vulcanimicrobiota bacterium]